MRLRGLTQGASLVGLRRTSGGGGGGLAASEGVRRGAKTVVLSSQPASASQRAAPHSPLRAQKAGGDLLLRGHRGCERRDIACLEETKSLGSLTRASELWLRVIVRKARRSEPALDLEKAFDRRRRRRSVAPLAAAAAAAACSSSSLSARLSPPLLRYSE